MNPAFKTIMVGTRAHRVSVSLTEAASQIIDGLPGTIGHDNVLDQDALLSTIVITKAAAGELRHDNILLDAPDILHVLHQSSAAGFVNPPARK